MKFYVVKVYEENVGLHAPIIAVGDKDDCLAQLHQKYGQDANIEFGPSETDFSKFGLQKLEPGIYPEIDTTWVKE